MHALTFWVRVYEHGMSCVWLVLDVGTDTLIFIDIGHLLFLFLYPDLFRSLFLHLVHQKLFPTYLFPTIAGFPGKEALILLCICPLVWCLICTAVIPPLAILS